MYRYVYMYVCMCVYVYVNFKIRNTALIFLNSPCK